MSIFYKIKDIKAIRVFGYELIRLLFYSLVLMFLITEILLPMGQYNIKPSSGVLNQIIGEKMINSGIEFDSGSFKIIDSHGMNFNHLFLCIYEIEGEEEARIIHFKKNIFGNMKPKDDFNDYYVISKSTDRDNFHYSYIEDGIFGGYSIVAGFGDSSSEPVKTVLNKNEVVKTQPNGYFMWVELANQPWKSSSIKAILIFIAILIESKYGNRPLETVKFRSKWRKGDRIFRYIKKDDLYDFD